MFKSEDPIASVLLCVTFYSFNLNLSFSFVQLLNNFRKKIKGRVDLTEFMQHLADHYNCDSPYKLGIRINSIALAISVSHSTRMYCSGLH